MTESGQLDLVDILLDQTAAAEDNLTNLEERLSLAIDENPNEKLFMEMFDHVTDAEQSMQAFRHLLETMQRRDEEEIP